MDRFASVTAFVRVIDSGGFSAAGRRLNLSKARVSHLVGALEDALGVRLLNRSTRRMSLTEAGRDYYERCVQVLQDLAEADEAAGAQRGTPRGQLRIYCHENVAWRRAGRRRLCDAVSGGGRGPLHWLHDDRPHSGGIRPGG